LINYLYSSDSENITWNEVFNDTRINLKKLLFLCLENENETMHKNYPKKIQEYMENNNISDFHEMSNYEILNAYGLTKSTFGFDSDTQGINNNEPYGQINTNDSNILRYSNFNFDLEVSELSNNLRIGILIFTIVVFLLFFTSWYLQFYIGEKLDKMQKE
jgi:hypothetical protein